jgi:DNA primase
LRGWQPRTRRGEQWRGRCPLHGSTSPTSRCFAVHLGKGVFHCFRCGAGGNALDLYAAATRQPLYPAAVELCRRLGQAVPWLPTAPRGENTTMSDP